MKKNRKEIIDWIFMKNKDYHKNIKQYYSVFLKEIYILCMFLLQIRNERPLLLRVYWMFSTFQIFKVYLTQSQQYSSWHYIQSQFTLRDTVSKNWEELSFSWVVTLIYLFWYKLIAQNTINHTIFWKYATRFFWIIHYILLSRLGFCWYHHKNPYFIILRTITLNLSSEHQN